MYEKVDIKGLLTGVANSIFVKEQVESIAKERIEKCNTCPYYSPNARKNGYRSVRPDKHCIVCGCNMYLKTRYLSAHCPIGDPEFPNFPGEPLWLAVTDTETSDKLLNTQDIKKEMDNYKINMNKRIDEHGD